MPLAPHSMGQRRRTGGGGRSNDVIKFNFGQYTSLRSPSFTPHSLEVESAAPAAFSRLFCSPVRLSAFVLSFLSDWRRRRGAGDANHENEPLNATTRSLGRFIFGRTGVQGATGDRAGFVAAKTSAHVQDPGRPPCHATPSLSVCPARARSNNCPETERPQLAATALGQSVTPRPGEDLWWGVTEGREDRIKKGVVRGKATGT